jgi:hypothetical protein
MTGAVRATELHSIWTDGAEFRRTKGAAMALTVHRFQFRTV